MSIKVSLQASTALEWAFGAYADSDPGIPFDLIRVADMPSDGEVTPEEIDALAKILIGGAVTDGLAGRICLGWCTFRKDGRFGIGVMALQKTTPGPQAWERG